MGALNAAGQIHAHNEQGRAVDRSNRNKLLDFKERNENYMREVMLDNNEWKNEVQLQDIEQDQVYQAMVTQWSQQDQQLDKIFAQGDQKIEKAIVEMYENDYAGTGTGRTAARLAGKSAKKLGQYKSEVLHSMMMSADESQLNKEAIGADAANRSRALYEKIRFSPIHGPTPLQPTLDAKPSKTGLILGLMSTALGTAAQAGAFKAPDVGSGTASSLTGGAEWGSIGDYTGIGGPTANIGGGSLTPGPAFGSTGWESISNPNFDWGDMGSSPWSAPVDPMWGLDVSAGGSNPFLAGK